MGFKAVILIIILTFLLVLGAYGIEKSLDRLSEKSSVDSSNSDSVDSITGNSTGLENTGATSETSTTTNSSTNTTPDSTDMDNTTSTNTTSESSNTTNSTDSDTGPETHVISMTSAGFSPATLTISIGDTVVFVNDDSSQHWPASYRHPTHTDYPGSGISKCGSSEEDTIFDSCGGISIGESYQFQFNEIGLWEYHDHLKPGLTGVMEVL